MILAKIKVQARLLAVVAGLSPAGCAFFPGEQPTSPLFGTWTTPDRNKVTFRPDAVVLTPEKGPQTTISKAECNGVYRLAYGRMQTAPLKQAFATQADLENKLRAILVQPEYAVADVTCDRGGTTYLLLGDREVVAIYRDDGIGGIEHYTRL
jgi:hypothetical protein